MPPGLRTRPPSSSTSREQNETPNKKQRLTQEEEEKQQQTQPPFTDTLAVEIEDGRVESPLTDIGETDVFSEEEDSKTANSQIVETSAVKKPRTSKKETLPMIATATPNVEPENRRRSRSNSGSTRSQTSAQSTKARTTPSVLRTSTRNKRPTPEQVQHEYTIQKLLQKVSEDKSAPKEVQVDNAPIQSAPVDQPPITLTTEVDGTLASPASIRPRTAPSTDQEGRMHRTRSASIESSYQTSERDLYMSNPVHTVFRATPLVSRLKLASHEPFTEVLPVQITTGRARSVSSAVPSGESGINNALAEGAVSLSNQSQASAPLNPTTAIPTNIATQPLKAQPTVTVASNNTDEHLEMINAFTGAMDGTNHIPTPIQPPTMPPVISVPEKGPTQVSSYPVPDRSDTLSGRSSALHQTTAPSSVPRRPVDALADHLEASSNHSATRSLPDTRDQMIAPLDEELPEPTYAASASPAPVIESAVHSEPRTSPSPAVPMIATSAAEDRDAPAMPNVPQSIQSQVLPTDTEAHMLEPAQQTSNDTPVATEAAQIGEVLQVAGASMTTDSNGIHVSGSFAQGLHPTHGATDADHNSANVIVSDDERNYDSAMEDVQMTDLNEPAEAQDRTDLDNEADLNTEKPSIGTIAIYKTVGASEDRPCAGLDIVLESVQNQADMHAASGTMDVDIDEANTSQQPIAPLEDTLNPADAFLQAFESTAIVDNAVVEDPIPPEHSPEHQVEPSAMIVPADTDAAVNPPTDIQMVTAPDVSSGQKVSDNNERLPNISVEPVSNMLSIQPDEAPPPDLQLEVPSTKSPTPGIETLLPAGDLLETSARPAPKPVLSQELSDRVVRVLALRGENQNTDFSSLKTILGVTDTGPLFKHLDKFADQRGTQYVLKASLFAELNMDEYTEEEKAVVRRNKETPLVVAPPAIPSFKRRPQASPFMSDPNQSVFNPDADPVIDPSDPKAMEALTKFWTDIDIFTPGHVSCKDLDITQRKVLENKYEKAVKMHEKLLEQHNKYVEEVRILMKAVPSLKSRLEKFGAINSRSTEKEVNELKAVHTEGLAHKEKLFRAYKSMKKYRSQCLSNHAVKEFCKIKIAALDGK